MGFKRSWVQIPPARLLQWHWIDVGVAHCLDSSNKILSPTIPSVISYAKTFQRAANPPPNTGEGIRQRARNDGNAPPLPHGPSLLLAWKPSERGDPLSRRFLGRHGPTDLHARAEVHLH